MTAFAPLHYRRKMRNQYPADWPAEAFSFWANYCWSTHSEPTIEQWVEHKAKVKRSKNARSARKASRMAAHREGLAKLYRAVQ